MTDGGVPRVVIVGGGFGGLFAARALRKSPVSVTLIDRAQHHLFQPLLYQVATGILSEGQISAPLRQVLRRLCRGWSSRWGYHVCHDLTNRVFNPLLRWKTLSHTSHEVCPAADAEVQRVARRSFYVEAVHSNGW